MANEQSMTQAIIQVAIETIKAALMAVREAENIVNNTKAMHTTPELGGPTLKQPKG